MKHKIFKTLLAVAVATMTFCADADTETINGIEWTYSVENGKASLESGGGLDPAIPTSTSGAITIPSTLGGYPVTSIGDGAFYDCRSLTSITIPNSVTSIGDWAFCYCRSLTSVTIPNSVTNIGECAFFRCSSLTSVTIPNSVTSIEKGAFIECGELTIYTDKGNADRLRKMLKNAGANVKEIIAPRHIGFYLGCGFAGLILGGLLFWIVRRKNKREGASAKTGQ